MNKSIIFLFSLLFYSSLFADWGSDILSVDAIKHGYLDDSAAHVRGTIIETFGRDGFKLADDTGELRVRFGNDQLRDFAFHSGMRVEVRGDAELEHNSWDLRASAIKLLN